MSLADRATIGNMAPEYGATMGFFPVDDETLNYLRAHRPHRPTKSQLVERYCKEQGLFRTDDAPAPTFTKTVALDLGTVEPCLAGPKRPQDRVPLAAHEGNRSTKALAAPIAERGFGLDDDALARNGNGRRQRPLGRDRATAPSSSPPSRAAPTPAIPR